MCFISTTTKAGLIAATVALIIQVGCVQKAPEISDKSKPDLPTESELKICRAKDAFDRKKQFDPLSLVVEGRRQTFLGRRIKEVRSELHIGLDPNGEFSAVPDPVTDYFSMDPRLSLQLNEGSVNGILFVAALEDGGRIFDVSGSWLFDLDLENEGSVNEARSAIEEKLFPELKDKLRIEPGWEYSIEKDTLSEQFTISLPEAGRPYASLYYEVRMK